MIRLILIFTFLIVNLSQLSLAKIASVIGNPNTEEIYFEVNKDTRNYPASLTKIMTLYIIFDEIKLGNLGLNDEIKFSKYATLQQPSKLNIDINDSITLDEAIDALIVKSANDVAVAVAEKISGSEKKFVKKMNKYAKRLKLKNTNFANPHGLPNKSNLSSAYDIFLLSSKLVKNYPEYLYRFKKIKIKIKGKTYKTHNKLLIKDNKYVGLKTGYIRKSGFQISLLSKTNNNYLLGIYFGGNSAKERDNKIHFLMNKYQNKNSKILVKKETSKTNKSKKKIIIQTSSFKKISLSKKHIVFMTNKFDFLRQFNHHIGKNGKYFTSYLEIPNYKLANSICEKIKLKRLDCIVKTI